MFGLSKLWAPAPVAPPVIERMPYSASQNIIATLEARLHAQTRELGRLRAEDALKTTVIADLRAKLDRFTAPRERQSNGRFVSAKREAAHV
jgi:uncharacterized small protein (DUF1192 family)